MIKWGGGGGQVIFHVVSRGRGSLDLKFARRGVIQSLNDRSKFQPPPRHLNNERSLMRRIFHKQTHMIA